MFGSQGLVVSRRRHRANALARTLRAVEPGRPAGVQAHRRAERRGGAAASRLVHRCAPPEHQQVHCARRARGASAVKAPCTVALLRSGQSRNRKFCLVDPYARVVVSERLLTSGSMATTGLNMLSFCHGGLARSFGARIASLRVGSIEPKTRLDGFCHPSRTAAAPIMVII